MLSIPIKGMLVILPTQVPNSWLVYTEWRTFTPSLVQRKQRECQWLPGFIFLFSPHLPVGSISVSVNQFKLLIHHETEYTPSHSSPPNCCYNTKMLNYIIPSCLWLFYSCFSLLFLKCAHCFKLNCGWRGFSSCLLWELRNPKEPGGVLRLEWEAA